MSPSAPSLPSPPSLPLLSLPPSLGEGREESRKEVGRERRGREGGREGEESKRGREGGGKGGCGGEWREGMRGKEEGEAKTGEKNKRIMTFSYGNRRFYGIVQAILTAMTRNRHSYPIKTSFLLGSCACFRL